MSIRFAAVSAIALAAAATSPVAAQTRIALGQSMSGNLTASDSKLNDGSHYDCWVLEPGAGPVTIDLSSDAFDTFLAVGTGSNCSDAMALIDTDDDGAGGTNSRLRLSFTQPRVLIRANALREGETGGYTLRVSGGSAARAAAPGRPAAPAASGRRISLAELEQVPNAQTYTTAMVCAAVDMYVDLRTEGEPDLDSMRLSNALVARAKSEGSRLGFDEDQVIAHMGDMLLVLYGDEALGEQARSMRSNCRATVQ